MAKRQGLFSSAPLWGKRRGKMAFREWFAKVYGNQFKGEGVDYWWKQAKKWW